MVTQSAPGVNGENVELVAQLAREMVEAQYDAENGVGLDSIASTEGKAILDDEAVDVVDIAVAGENFRQAEKNTTGEGGVRFMSRENSTRIKQQIDAVSEQLNKMDVVVSVVSDDFLKH